MLGLPEKLQVSLKGHQSGSIRSVAFNSDGKYCLTAGTDRTVCLWNPEKNVCLKVYSGHGHEVLDARSSKDNANIISGSKDKSIIVWDVLSGQAMRRFRQHFGQVSCVRYNMDECSIIFSGSSDNTVCCWDARSRSNSPIQILKDAKDAVLSIDILRHQILTGSVDNSIRTYDLRMGSITQDNIRSSVSSCKFIFEGNSIIAGCNDDTVKLIDTADGKVLTQYFGHKNGSFKIDCTVILKDSVVVTGSEDGYVYFWDLVDSKIIKKLKAHDGVVYSIDFHPNTNENTTMITASTDGVKLWTV